MVVDAPDFIKSPYLIIDEKGWRLKDTAPDQLKEEFKDFMNLIHSDN